MYDFTPYYFDSIDITKCFRQNLEKLDTISYLASRNLLLTSNNEFKIHVWNLNSSIDEFNFSSLHTKSINHLKVFSESDSHSVISVSSDTFLGIHKLSQKFNELNEQSFYSCHKDIVNYIENDPCNNNIFFSTSNDGIIRQYDNRTKYLGCSRCPTSTPLNVGSMYESSNCLLKLYNGTNIKSMKINPQNSNLFVISLNKNYVSLYDRRMLSLCSPNENLDIKPIQRFSPTHIIQHQENNHESSFAEFSKQGNEILTSFQSDFCYLFPLPRYYLDDSSQKSKCFPFEWRKKYNNSLDIQSRVNSINEKAYSGMKSFDLGLLSVSYLIFSRAYELSTRLISSIEEKKISKNILETIYYIHANILNFRASICTKRFLAGDLEAALEDIDEALIFHPTEVESLFKKAKILILLNKISKANKIINSVSKILSLQVQDEDNIVFQYEVEKFIKEYDQTRIATNPPLLHNSIDSDVQTKYLQRYIGRRLESKDFYLKLFGQEDEFIIGYSKDGYLILWDKYTGEIVLYKKISDGGSRPFIEIDPIHFRIFIYGRDLGSVLVLEINNSLGKDSSFSNYESDESVEYDDITIENFTMKSDKTTEVQDFQITKDFNTNNIAHFSMLDDTFLFAKKGHIKKDEKISATNSISSDSNTSSCYNKKLSKSSQSTYNYDKFDSFQKYNERNIKSDTISPKEIDMFDNSEAISDTKSSNSDDSTSEIQNQFMDSLYFDSSMNKYWLAKRQEENNWNHSNNLEENKKRKLEIEENKIALMNYYIGVFNNFSKGSFLDLDDIIGLEEFIQRDNYHIPTLKND